MNLIYTSRTEGFEPGGLYRNPRFFQGPEKGVSSVLVEGDWPEIVEAYRAFEVPVELLPEVAAQHSDQDGPANERPAAGLQAAPGLATPAAKAQRGRRPAAAGVGTTEA
ncbi:hypothetical protein [Chromobacterium haemolyticum]|uniref:hypothetical protein n=1 Tax=Chromobacterium haemolyticum TaxID=394935 RepID=UPI0009DAA262|nr:hypothetical protein [Chromobacterium haemolyticum]OQS32987.1 hypothetical protein B0T39_21635 [Chromobacterium haemolyticum]